MRYAMIIEPGERNYSAYLPDLPGCVATGKTIDELFRTAGADEAIYSVPRRRRGRLDRVENVLARQALIPTISS